jgi:predicted Ser/Thr protein kinase
MKRGKNILIMIAGAVICLMAARLAMSVTGIDRTKYEVTPWITTPEYQTDTTRAIEAYERLMERYMDLSESYLIDSQSVAQKIESIDAKMDDLSARLARIEKALGIDPNGNPSPSKALRPSGAK